MNKYNATLAAVAHLYLKRNDDVTLYATLTDPNNNDNLYDLTQFADIKMQVKRSRGDTDPFFELSLLAGGLNIESAGVLRITLTSANMGLKPAKYYYDVQGFTPNRTLLEGDFIINPDVTT